jgi:hypothetical protein
MKIESNTPLVTFGIVNCNRLFYLKSCFETLYEATNDYPNREFIVVDNASVEEGTEEYLNSLESRGVNVIRQPERDPSNEFAKGVNLICRLAKGKYICPLQGDMQFTANHQWLQAYVDFYEENYDNVGCIIFDAQRSITNFSHKEAFSTQLGTSDFKFVFNSARSPISGAGDVMYSRKVIELIYPWNESNLSHEGGQDSETAMLQKVQSIMTQLNWRPISAAPMIPVSAAIYTDARGTNARIRGNRRYGDYWAPKDGIHYYLPFETEVLLNKLPCAAFSFPHGIEAIAHPNGWEAPIDDRGSWLKNPIRPETALKSDYVDLIETTEVLSEEENYISDWLGE